jgi:hypothetical protein
MKSHSALPTTVPSHTATIPAAIDAAMLRTASDAAPA